MPAYEHKVKTQQKRAYRKLFESGQNVQQNIADRRNVCGGRPQMDDTRGPELVRWPRREVDAGDYGVRSVKLVLVVPRKKNEQVKNKKCLYSR